MQHPGAVLAALTELDLAAEMMRHQLHPVTNSKDRNPEKKNRRIELRRALVVNAGWSAREHDAFRFQLRDLIRRDIEANDLGINLALADAARDDLRVLRTEIENKNLGMSGQRGGFHDYGCVSEMDGFTYGSSVRSIGPSVPSPRMPRWNFSEASCAGGFSSGSAQLPRRIALAMPKAIKKAFKH